MLGRILIRSVLQPYWRLTRSQTLGVQAVVVEKGSRVLLIRHSYVRGWHLPGGGVERGESCLAALRRELKEEAGIQIDMSPTLHGIFANFERSKGDHIVVYVVEKWTQVEVPRRSLEVIERKFFEVGSFPEGLIEGAKRRLAEVFYNQPLPEEW